MLTRRNLLLRCSIIANLAVLVYIGMHIIVKSGPVEYGYEPAPLGTSFTLQGTSKDQLRTFIMDKNQEPTVAEVKFNSSAGAVVAVNSSSVQTEAVYAEQPEEEVGAGSTQLTVAQDETVLDVATLESLRNVLNCQDKSFEPSTRQRGEFWVLHNFVRAEHGPLGCHETITYTTHGDFTFMDNLVPLLEKLVSSLNIAFFRFCS